MKKDVISVYGNMEVRSLIAILATNKISGVSVIDDKKKLIGVVSKTDIVDKLNMEQLLFKERKSIDYDPYGDGVTVYREIGADFFEKKVADFMTRDVVTAHPDEPIESIRDKMISRRIHRVIVIDEKNAVKGQISVMDLLPMVK
jgi:CBS domain-containing protein